MSAPTACLRCGRPLPERLERRGRPRRFCDDACRKAYQRANAAPPPPVVTGLPDDFVPASLPPRHGPRTPLRRQETADAVVAFLDGAEPASLEDRLQRALIETRAVSGALRRLGAELKPGLGARATGLADSIDDGTRRWFEGLLDG